MKSKTGERDILNGDGFFLDTGEIITYNKLRMYALYMRIDPGVAQLVARLVRDQEAVGSNPATRTKRRASPMGVSVFCI